MKITDIVKRVLAVFGAEAMTAIGGGAMLKVELWKSAAIAGFVAVSTVLGKLFRAYQNDGKVTRAEANEIFGGAQ